MLKRRGRGISNGKSFSRRAGALFMVGTVLGGGASPLLAQAAPPAPSQTPAAPPAQPSAPASASAPARAPAPAPAQGTIRAIRVEGSQRIEPETIRAYANLSPGQTYTAQTLDQAL